MAVINARTIQGIERRREIATFLEKKLADAPECVPDRVKVEIRETIRQLRGAP
jgi:hypothetical protein